MILVDTRWSGNVFKDIGPKKRLDNMLINEDVNSIIWLH